ncbi:ATP-binding protein [Halobacteriales archaeon Cl-PHB]
MPLDSEQLPAVSQRALDSLPMNIAVLDDEGTIISTDDAWRTFAEDNDKQGNPDSIGTNYLAVAEDSDELGDVAADGLRNVLEGHRDEFTLEYPCHSPDEQRWFMMWAGGFTYDGDRFATVAHFDITQRVLAEQELEGHAEMLSNQRDELALLNEIVRHDIRNDVQLIATYAELADAGTDVDSQIEKILTQCSHVIGLTDAVRDLSDVITGEHDPTLSSMDVVAVLRSEADKLRSNYAGTDTEVTVSGLEDLPHVCRVQANEMLSSVLRNLLTNAVVHHDGSDVSIDVAVTTEAETVTITIADDGPGVGPERRAEVFGRGEKGLESPGTGIGLYLVDRLVDIYGGDVEIGESDRGGARFDVTLSLA